MTQATKDFINNYLIENQSDFLNRAYDDPTLDYEEFTA